MTVPMMVLLEGISGCGKSTLRHPLSELSDYRDMIFERYTPSMWVYNQVNQRPQYDYEWINLAAQDAGDVIAIWLRVDPVEALRRKQAKGDLDRIEDLVAADGWFEWYFDEVTSLTTVHRLDTTHMSPDVTLRTIADLIYGG